MATLIRPSPAMEAFTVAVMVVAVFLPCAFTAAGTNHTVGDSGGWDLTTDLSAWSASQTFLVNDTLVFNYGPNHDVIEVNEADFETCRMARPVHIFDDGETVVELLNPGPRFFICGRNHYCDFGLKLQIQVQDRAELGLGLNFPSPIAQSPSPNGTSTVDLKGRPRPPRPPRSPPSPHFAHPPPPPPRSHAHPPPPPPTHKGGDDRDLDDVAPAPNSARKLLDSKEEFSFSYSSSTVMLGLLSLVVLWGLGVGLFGLLMIILHTLRFLIVFLFGIFEAAD